MSAVVTAVLADSMGLLWLDMAQLRQLTGRWECHQLSRGGGAQAGGVARPGRRAGSRRLPGVDGPHRQRRGNLGPGPMPARRHPGARRCADQPGGTRRTAGAARRPDARDGRLRGDARQDRYHRAGGGHHAGLASSRNQPGGALGQFDPVRRAQANASDVHLECDANGLRALYRLDGVLVPITEIPGSDTAEQVISRIKVMAELDIAERRVPQDGRFKVRERTRDIDFRVSVMPSISARTRSCACWTAGADRASAGPVAWTAWASRRDHGRHPRAWRESPTAWCW